MIKNSTQLLAASEADFKMLKEKGKEGEWALHYHGYLDGYAQGAMDARNGWLKTVEQGLPTEDGFYLVRSRRTKKVEYVWFTVQGNKDVTPQNCAYDYWMPIPEITED